MRLLGSPRAWYPETVKPSPPPTGSSSAPALPPASASGTPTPSASATPSAASGEGPAATASPAPKSSASLKQLAPAVVEWERPPEGLQRGTWAAPRWAVVALGAFVVFVAAAYLVRRLRQRREA